MPIKSKSQWRALAAKDQKVFEQFKRETRKSYDELPERIEPIKRKEMKVTAEKKTMIPRKMKRPSEPDSMKYRRPASMD